MLGLLLFAGLLVGAAPARAQPLLPPPQLQDNEVPPRVELPRAGLPPPEGEPRTGLAIAGAAVLGAGWMFVAVPEALCEAFDYHFHGSSGSSSSSWPLLIPLAGPWAQLAANLGDHVTPPFVNAALVMDGVMQAAGLAMLVAGVVTRTRPDQKTEPHIGLAPLALRGGSGLAAIGTF